MWLGIALILVLIPAHLVWLFERRRPNGIISSPNYFPGIFEAFFWAISTLTGSPEAMPHQWVARTFAIFWIFTGVVFVAFYTAQLTTTLTVEQIRGAIEGPSDLPGKQVATLAGSTAADYLRQQNAQVQEFATTDQVYKALLDKKVDAVVLPAPVLLYYAAHEGKGRVKTVGPEFNTAPAAIMVQLDSPLRRKINLALIALRENGTYQQIYDKWFGTALLRKRANLKWIAIAVRALHTWCLLAERLSDGAGALRSKSATPAPSPTALTDQAVWQSASTIRLRISSRFRLSPTPDFNWVAVTRSATP